MERAMHLGQLDLDILASLCRGGSPRVNPGHHLRLELYRLR